MFVEEEREVLINHPTLPHRGENHSHSVFLVFREKIRKSSKKDIRVECLIIVIDTRIRHMTEAIPHAEHQVLIQAV
jgi:hypothetical protein